MKNNNLKLKTAFDIGYELKNVLFYGKKITRNICGFNVTMHFKKGVCKVKINNIEKINIMVHLNSKYRNIDFNNFDEKQIDKLEYIFNKIKSEIKQQYYDINEEICEYLTDDLNCCYVVYLCK